MILFVTSAAFAGPPERAGTALKVGPIDQMELRAGDSVGVEILLSIARGFHVNANPAASEDYIPLEVVLTDSAGLQVGTAVYPPSKIWRLEGGTDNLKVYEGRFSVRLPLIIAPNARPGKRVLRGTVEFQACNNRLCLMPDSRPFKLSVKIVSRSGL